MPLKTYKDLEFGKPEAEHDRPLLENAFFVTDKIRRIHSNERLPFLVGRKGSGKSAASIHLEIEADRAGECNFIKFVPSDFRHVEIRELLKSLISGNTSWQYIYQKVWEGIVLGQLVRHLIEQNESKITYRFSQKLHDLLIEFSEKCSFYVKALDDALSAVIIGFIKKKARSTNELELVELRTLLEPYNWKLLLKTIDDEFSSKQLPRITICIDGLDEHWDNSDPSLYFLAQLLQVANALSAKLQHSVRFVICLRDNIFRALVDTKCIEYDKIESSINYLDWDGFSLFELIARRAFYSLPPIEAIANLRAILPESIDGTAIDDYLGRHVLNRPRDYINVFRLLQAECYNLSRASQTHIKDVIGRYSANRLVDLENEFGHTYPGISKVVSALQIMPATFQKDALINKLTEMCNNDELKREAPELFLHYADPIRLSHILISIGVLGCYQPTDQVLKFVQEFSETRVISLFAHSDRFGLHPVYVHSMAAKEISPSGRFAINGGTQIGIVTDPSDYISEKDSIQDLDKIAQKTEHRKTEVLAEITAIHKGQPHFRRFEVWALKALKLCFIHDLSDPVEQTVNSEGTKRFEMIFDIIGNAPPWEEIKSRYQAHRLLVECKNTDVPTDADISKLDRDMTALDLRVAFLVYRNTKREPTSSLVTMLRSRYQNSSKTRVIVAVSDAFLIQCLRKNDEKCRKNLSSLWRDHLETWLIL